MKFEHIIGYICFGCLYLFFFLMIWNISRCLLGIECH